MRALGLVGLASLFAVLGCNLQQLLDPTSDAGSTAAADGGASSSSTSTTPQGADCTNVGGGNTLCEFISSCPDDSLSTSLFPHCGFRISGSTLDMECWCVDSLCPVGIATSCDQIANVVGDQTEDTVCAKALTGGCSSLAGTDASVTTGNTSCNPACTDGCGNTPECQQACGC